MSNAHSKKSPPDRDNVVLPGSLVMFITDEGMAGGRETWMERGAGLVVGSHRMRGGTGTFGYRHTADVLWGDGRVYDRISCQLLTVVFSGVEQLSGSA
jgi:hypothetical protein